MHSAEPTSLLKPIPVPTQTKPAMPTISLIKSTNSVSISALSLTALSFSSNRHGPQFTNQFNLSSSSISSRFQLMKVETQRQLVSSSIKFSPHTTVRIEEVNTPLDEARQTAMTSISKPLPTNNIIGLNLSKSNELVVYNQLDAVMRALHTESIVAARSSALSLSGVQQTSTSVTPLTGEH